MRLWEIREFKGDYIIFPKTHLYCPFCANELLVHDFRTYLGVDGFYYCDVRLKCIYCEILFLAGVPVSREEHLKLKQSKYHMKTLRHELLEIYKDDEKVQEIIKKKLEKWGYW